MPQRVPSAWHSDMQLPGKLLLSAAALLLLSLAFRFYRNRSPPPGKIPPGEQRENRDGDGALRRRRRRRDGGGKSGNGPGMRHAALRGEQSFPRNEEEEEEEEGEEVGLELGLIPREAPLGMARMERELGRKLGIKSESEAGVELGRDPGSRTGELGSEPGSQPRSKLGIKPGNNPGRKPGSEPRSKLITKPGNELGSAQAKELGNKLGINSGIELGNEQGSEPGSKLGNNAGTEVGSELGILLGSDLGSKAGVEAGSEPGILLGSEPGSHDPGAEAAARSSPAGTDAAAPSSGRSPGTGDARTEGDGCAQSTEQDPAGAGRSREGSPGTVRTLSVTSSLGLLLTASEAGSDTSYCFSSVAKIQVEESFIPERRDKDKDNPPRPGLRGKVYDYFVQSTSEAVSRRRSLPYIPAGTSRQWGQAAPQSSGTQGENPALEIPDPDTSTPQEGRQSPPEPPSPGWKGSTPGIAPQLPLPGEVPSPSQVLRPGQVHLGNCSEVLRAAKARQLRALRDAALQVMSAHLLHVLRSPAIYGRLNAGERELLPALRSRGRPRLVVADVPPAEPGHRRGRLCYYDEDADRWCQLCQLPAEVAGRGCAACSMFNYLFVAPGWEGAGRARSPSRRVLCYDPLGDSWRDICPLRQARPRCQLLALDGHLYAIGGECLATVERYDPRRDLWAFAAALPRDTFAVAHAAAACHGDIFVTGGTLRSLLLRYDARGDSWATSPAVGDQDGTAALVSAHGFLYRFQLRRGAGGGEVAVSRCSGSARLWYGCGSHPLPEPAGLRCAALGGLVHCLGRGFHLRFLADPGAPRFGAKELRPFPEPHGSLLPAVLVLPEGGTEPPRP